MKKKIVIPENYLTRVPARPSALRWETAESGMVTLLVENTGLKPGDKLRYVPGHCCTTINIFDRMYAIEGEEVVDCWQVTSRGKAQ